jgi:lipid-A-disaccharide synthase
MLVKELRNMRRHVEFFGIGGPRMRDAGVCLLAETTRYSAIGLFAALPYVLVVWSIFRRFLSLLTERRPDAFIALDFGAVNRRLTKITADMRIPTVYYVTPGFWTRKIESVKRYIHPKVIYVPIYEWQRNILLSAGASPEQVIYLGHPLADAVSDELTREGAEARLELQHKEPFEEPIRIALLPGSRVGEVKDNIGIMLSAVEHAKHLTGVTDFELLIARSPTVSEALIAKAVSKASNVASKARVRIYSGMTHEVLKASDIALVVTGTATLEAALLCVPTIAIFSTNWLNRIHAIIINKTSFPFKEWGFIALPNRLIGEKVMPEFVLWSCEAKSIGRQIASWISNPSEAEAVANKLASVRKIIGERGTTRRVAELIMSRVS